MRRQITGTGGEMSTRSARITSFMTTRTSAANAGATLLTGILVWTNTRKKAGVGTSKEAAVYARKT